VVPRPAADRLDRPHAALAAGIESGRASGTDTGRPGDEGSNPVPRSGAACGNREV